MSHDAFSRSPATRSSSVLKSVLMVVAGVAVMTLSAKTQIPFWPVPMTLHTLAVMVFAVVLGPRMSMTIFASYLAVGAIGLPVFAGTPEKGIGIAYMTGPTGGYLAGFFITSGLVGWLAAGRGVMGKFFAMIAGMVPVYGLGLIWLVNFVPADKLLAFGFLPFILGDLVKITIAALSPMLLMSVMHWFRGPAQ